MEAEQRARQEAAAEAIAKGGLGFKGFFARLERRLASERIHIPSVSIAYRNVVHVAEASSATNAVPGLGPVLWRFAKARRVPQRAWERGGAQEAPRVHSPPRTR